MYAGWVERKLGDEGSEMLMVRERDLHISPTIYPIILSPSLMQALLSTQFMLSRSCLACLFLSILVMASTEERQSASATVLSETILDVHVPD